MGKILFSAIGSSDPVRNFHDGGWLHCLRKELPEKTVIYLSAQMSEYEGKYHFYSEAMRLFNEDLAKEGKPPIEIDYIWRRDLTNPHLSGYLHTDFMQILTELHEQNPKSELLINVSSGTPAMKSSLADMKIFLPFGNTIRFLQVDGPNDGREFQHGRIDEHYNLLENWECNDDRAPEVIWRVHPLHTAERDLLSRAMYAARLIRVHEYHAARMIVEGDLEYYANGEAVKEALLGADQRTMLQLHMAGTNLAKAGIAHQNLASESNKRTRQCAEMALTMQNDIAAHDYANMLRKMTPLMYGLSLEQFIKEFKYNPEDYEYKSDCRDKSKIGKCDWNKLGIDHPDFLTAVREALNGKDPGGYLADFHYITMIERNGRNREIIILLKQLRKVENNARNEAAHELQGIGEGWIKNKTGMTPEQIMEKVRKLVQLIAPEYGKEFWNSYQEMDESICGIMTIQSVEDHQSRS